MITGSVPHSSCQFFMIVIVRGSGPMDINGLQMKQVGQERMSCVQNAWGHMASLL